MKVVDTVWACSKVLREVRNAYTILIREPEVKVLLRRHRTIIIIKRILKK
jgi:hypothetical protein